MIIANINDPKVKMLLRALTNLKKISSTLEYRDMVSFGTNVRTGYKILNRQVTIIDVETALEEIQDLIDTHEYSKLGGNRRKHENYISAIKYLEEVDSQEATA